MIPDQNSFSDQPEGPQSYGVPNAPMGGYAAYTPQVTEPSSSFVDPAEVRRQQNAQKLAQLENPGAALTQAPIDETGRVQTEYDKSQDIQRRKRDLDNLTNNSQRKAEDYNAMLAAHPELAGHIQQSWNNLNKEKQHQEISSLSGIYGALESGNPDIAKTMLESRAKAAHARGDKQEFEAANGMLNAVNRDPNSASTLVGLSLSAAMGADKFNQTFSNLQESKGGSLKQQKLDLETRNVESQIAEREARLKQGEQKAATKISDLSVGAQKRVADNETAASEALNSANKYESLSNKYAAIKPTAGLVGKAGEALKSVFGSQDEVTNLRREADMMLGSGILSHIPRGPASDKDVAFAARGFPKSTDNPEAMAAWSRGMAKISKYQADYNTAKVDWESSNGHMGTLKQGQTINGIDVPKGTTFNAYMKKYFSQAKAEDKDVDKANAEQMGKPATATKQPGFMIYAK